MIDTLFTQCIEQNDITPLSKIRPFLLSDTENEIISFLTKYVEKYGSVPTIERFQKEGYGHYVSSYMKGTPLSDLLEMTLDQKRQEYFIKKSNELQIEGDSTGKVNPAKLYDIFNKLSMTYVKDITSLTTYDRDKFYTPEKPDSLLFGWDTIDNPTGGILPGEYAILVARLGIGKTLVAVWLAVGWAKLGKKVLFVPCEMTLDQTVYRIDGILGGFNPLVFRTKRKYGLIDDDITDGEIKSMFDNYRAMVNSELKNIQSVGGEIMFPEQGVYNIKQIENLIQEKKPDITIIDAAYLLVMKNN